MEPPLIVQAGHPVLRGQASPVPPDMLGTRGLRELAATMVRAMHQAPGVGLAAPQLGISLALIVLEDAESLMSRLSPEQRKTRGRVPFPTQVIANPQLITHGTERVSFFEGCLSVPGYMALVERDLDVEVRGVGLQGEPIVWRASGWPARILQHEVDHLQGILYVDRMNPRTLATHTEVQSRWLALSSAEVEKALGLPNNAPERAPRV